MISSLSSESVRPVAASRVAVEILFAAFLLAAGLAPRLAFATLFPTEPISDFAGLVDFSVGFREEGLVPSSHQWQYRSPGMPMALAPILALFPEDPAATARFATAAVCGLLPLLPFFLWRGVLPLSVRAGAGLLLALWPGQILFSGVAAQDNWVLLPTVALGCLAARALLSGEGGHPVAAGLLYAAGVAIRQEALIALLPLLPAAAGWRLRGERRWRRLGIAGAVAGALVLLLALQRHAATGRFAVGAEAGSLSLLGAYVPGATENYWTDPSAHIAAVAPELLWDDQRMREAGLALTLQEAARRPAFHAARISALTLHFLSAGELDNFYWAIGAEALPDPVARERARAHGRSLADLLEFEMGLILGLTIAAVAVGIHRRNPAILVLTAAVAVKVGLHALIVGQGRYFLASTALQGLILAIAAWEVARRGTAAYGAAALAAGLTLGAAVAVKAPGLVEEVRSWDREEIQRSYRFRIASADESAWLDCEVDRGLLARLNVDRAILELLRKHPAPGEIAAADCRLGGGGSVALEIEDAFAPGNRPGRVRQRVTVDGEVLFDHDLGAEPGSGWSKVPLGPAGPEPRPVRIEVVAVDPDPWAAWGTLARTTFRLRTVQEGGE